MLRFVHARPPSSAHPWRAIAVGLLALAVLAAQALGFGHRIAHGPAAMGLAHAAWGGSAAEVHAELASDGRPHDQDHDHHRDHGPGEEHDCAAFEHATVADVAALPEPPRLDRQTPLAIGTPAASTSPFAAQAAGYLARGPPSA
jgi:hypothetical protein